MSLENRIKKLIHGLRPASVQERRGVLYLLPVLIVVSLLVVSRNKPVFESSFPLYADEKDRKATTGAVPRDNFYQQTYDQQIVPEGGLFRFDPNTVGYKELLRLGFTKRQAAGFIKYRVSGARFAIPEEFAACYQVSDAMYERLQPWISIGAEFRVKPLRDVAGHAGAVRRDSLFEFDPNLLTASQFASMGCFTLRQGEVIVNYRELKGGFHTVEDFARCYPVEDQIEKLRPYIKMPVAEPVAKAGTTPLRVELNSADTTVLATVRGIGPLTARRIVEYRSKLGGFHSVTQLCEITGMTESNYEKILKQITVDSCVIRKININFATLKNLETHPYLTGNVIRKILKNRQLKGGWRTLKDMTDDGTLSPGQAAKLAPYLDFALFEE